MCVSALQQLPVAAHIPQACTMVSPTASAFFSGGGGGALPSTHSSVGSTAAARAVPSAVVAANAITRPRDVFALGSDGLSPLRRRATLRRSLPRRSVPFQVLRYFISP